MHQGSGIVHRREMLLAQISLVIVLVFITRSDISHLNIIINIIIFSHSVKWVPNLWELRQAEMGKVGLENINSIKILESNSFAFTAGC